MFALFYRKWHKHYLRKNMYVKTFTHGSLCIKSTALDTDESLLFTMMLMHKNGIEILSNYKTGTFLNINHSFVSWLQYT